MPACGAGTDVARGVDVTAAFLMLAHDILAIAGEVAGLLGTGNRAVAAHIDASDVAAFWVSHFQG